MLVAAAEKRSVGYVLLRKPDPVPYGRCRYFGLRHADGLGRCNEFYVQRKKGNLQLRHKYCRRLRRDEEELL
jgi:hypothetical protein